MPSIVSEITATCPEDSVVSYETQNDKIQDKEMILGTATRVQELCKGQERRCPDDCKIKELISKINRQPASKRSSNY